MQAVGPSPGPMYHDFCDVPMDVLSASANICDVYTMNLCFAPPEERGCTKSALAPIITNAAYPIIFIIMTSDSWHDCINHQQVYYII